MNELFIYLIKAAFINTILLAFYYFTLRKSNRFHFMRITLLIAMVLPIIFPLIPYPNELHQNSANIPHIRIELPVTSISASDAGDNLHWTDISQMLYYGVSLVILVVMVISICAIIQKRIRSKQYLTSLGKIELEHTVKSPFSFFSWVFLSPTDLTHPQLDMILKHEFCHVREKHSIDRVLSGFFRSVLWFSPFAHITSRLLSEVHEYQADSKVIGVYDKGDYSDLILSFYLNPQPSAISNNFSLHIKNRIKMINNLSYRRLNYGSILTGLCFSLLLVILTSMVTKTDKPMVSVDQGVSDYTSRITVIGQVSDTMPPYPDVTPWFTEVYIDKINTDFKGHSGKVLVGLIIEADGITKDIRVVQSAGEFLDNWALNKIKQVKKWYPAMVDDKPVRYQLYYPFTFVSEDKVKLEGKLAFNPDTVLKAHQKDNNENDLPDSPPQFPGGDKARIEYIGANTPYPEDARNAGKEGTVYVQFVITPTGEVSSVKVLKSVYTSLDRVAYNAIVNMPKWIPAKKGNNPVSYEMTIPIKFELSDGKKDKAYREANTGYIFSKDNTIPQKQEGSRVFTVVEETPEFPGGDDARVVYLNNNIIYPEQARKQGIQGTVYITFVVEPDGSITGAKVLRGVGGGLDEVALEVVKNMPKWKPGKVKGEDVPVQFNMPIKFKLSEPEKKAE